MFFIVRSFALTLFFFFLSTVQALQASPELLTIEPEKSIQIVEFFEVPVGTWLETSSGQKFTFPEETVRHYVPLERVELNLVVELHCPHYDEPITLTIPLPNLDDQDSDREDSIGKEGTQQVDTPHTTGLIKVANPAYDLVYYCPKSHHQAMSSGYSSSSPLVRSKKLLAPSAKKPRLKKVEGIVVTKAPSSGRVTARAMPRLGTQLDQGDSPVSSTAASSIAHEKFSSYNDEDNYVYDTSARPSTVRSSGSVYKGNCRYMDDVDKSGRRCGKRSAEYRSGGF